MEKELKFRLFEPREYNMTLHVLPEAYRGLDREIPIKFIVNPENVMKRVNLALFFYLKKKRKITIIHTVHPL